MLSFWRVIAVAAVILLTGCAHSSLQDKPNNSSECRQSEVAACFRNPARYPEWLVGLIDPAAPVIGRTVAMVRFREGYLAHDERVQRRLSKELRPLDVLLVSSKGRLTGSAIPGLFTHAIIYLGSQAQIQSLGIWNDPNFIPLRESISSGKTFVESDHRGVHLSTAAQILDVDKVLVLRPRLGSPHRTRKSLVVLAEHLGSRFDYHFDAGEPNRLYCSELVFHVMPELGLPVRHLYRREVVLPDDVAATGLEPRTKLSFVLYLSGKARNWTEQSRRKAISDLAAYWRR